MRRKSHSTTVTIEPGDFVRGKVGFQAVTELDKSKINYGVRETEWSFKIAEEDKAWSLI